MKWNLAAFKKSTLLEELIEDYQSSPELTKVALKAGLKYFPNELWKLLVAVDGFYTELSPYAFLMDTNRTTMAREEGLTFIEECLGSGRSQVTRTRSHHQSVPLHDGCGF
jgi:hypothetical protein